MSDLHQKNCIPCRGGVSPFEIFEIHKYLKKVDGWDVKKKEDEIYFVDFIGCKIYDENKSFIGIAKDIIHFPGDNHVMVIEKELKEFMVPVRNDLIKLFDVDEKYIIIEIIDNLIDNV